MNFNIFEFVKRMLPSFKKDDVETDLDVSIQFFENTVVPSYKSMERVYKIHKFNSPETKKIIGDFYKYIKPDMGKLKLKGLGKFEVDIIHLVTSALVPNGRYIQKEIDKIISNTVLSSGLSARKAFLLRAVTHYHFMSKYATDLCNYILIKEAENTDLDLRDSFKLNKKQVQMIEQNIEIFARLLGFYARDPSEFDRSINKIPDVIIPDKNIEAQIDEYTQVGAEPIPSLPKGFVGSPIYSIRLIFAQWEADRYNELKDKRKLIELRCLHLESLKERGDSDPNLERDIAYLQDRLTDIDYKMAKIEESVK
jgi:hypothetical protein